MAEPTLAHFEYVRKYELEVGDLVLTDYRPDSGSVGMGRGPISTISDDRMYARIAGWGLNVRMDSEGFGYWGGDNDRGILLLRTPVANNADFAHDGVFTSFARKDNVFHFKNGITGANITVDIDAVKNNVTYTAPGELSIGQFSILALEERSMFIVENVSKRQFCVDISMIRIFNDSDMAARFIDATKEAVDKKIKAKAEMSEKMKGISAGSFVRIDTEKLSRDNRYYDTGSIRTILRTVERSGPVYSVISVNILESYATVRIGLAGESYDVNTHVDSLIMATEEEFKKQELETGLRLLRRKADEYTETILKGQCEKSTVLFSKLIHSLRKESDIIGSMGDNYDEKIARLNTMISGEIEEIKRDKRIKSAQLDKGTLSIEIVTNDLFIRSLDCIHNGVSKNVLSSVSDKPVKMGEFTVRIDLFDGRIDCTRTSSVEGIRGCHPHVSSHVCWGNMESEVVKLIADFKVNDVIQILLQILENINIHSVYNRLHTYWEGCKYIDICGENDIHRQGNAAPQWEYYDDEDDDDDDDDTEEDED